MGDTSPFSNSRTVSGLRTRGTQAPQHFPTGVMLGRNGFSAVVPLTLPVPSILCTVFLQQAGEPIPGMVRETGWFSASELLLFEGFSNFAIFKVEVIKPSNVLKICLAVVVVCTELDSQPK